MKILSCLCLALALLGFCGCSTVSNDDASTAIDLQPVAVNRAQPIYPFDLKHQGVSGKATVEFIVDQNGFVRDPKVVRATHTAFGLAALDAILKWKFSTPIKRGRAICARMQQDFLFSIEDAHESPLVKQMDQATDGGAKVSLDQMPIPRIRAQPVYPPDLKYHGISGKAEVEFIVDSNGDVRDPRVVSASREAFGLVSLDAILK